MYGAKRYMVTGEVTGNREVTVADESGLLVVHTAQSDNMGTNYGPRHVLLIFPLLAIIAGAVPRVFG
jgi:hypothetical protein